MNDLIVINASPLIAFGKMGLFPVLARMPVRLVAPYEVKAELDAGIRLGHRVEFPDWIEVRDLRAPRNPELFLNLDSGEAAVIQLALETNVDLVCLDEVKGRRIATLNGMKVIGSLGLLGKAYRLGPVPEVNKHVRRAQRSGIYYDQSLIERFLAEFGE